MVYKEKHKLWQLPQGGVDNKEDLLTALQREMQEELGRDFIELVEFLGTEKVMFPKQTQGARELFTDKGKEIKMQGKKYFIYAIKTKITKFDLNKSEFDDFKWLPYDEAIKLSQTIYQKGKKRLTLKSLQLLKDKKLV